MCVGRSRGGGSGGYVEKKCGQETDGSISDRVVVGITPSVNQSVCLLVSHSIIESIDQSVSQLMDE